MERATIQKIAERLGISKMTVSRSLRGIGRVNPTTRGRVRDVARELGYPVSADYVFGQPVHRGSSEHQLHVLIPILNDGSMTGDYPRLLLQGMQERLSMNAGTVDIVHCQSLDEIIDTWRSSHANGIVLRDQLPVSWVAALQAIGPVVLAVSMENYSQVDAAYSNEMRAATLLQRHLRHNGHESIAWFGIYDRHLPASIDPTADYDGVDHDRMRFSVHGSRYAAWTHIALAAQTPQTTLFLDRDWRTDSLVGVAHRALQALLATPQPPSVIVVPTTPMADCLATALDELGLAQRPEIACYAPAPHVLPDGRSCTSVVLPMHDIGRSIPDLIERRLANPEAVPLTLMFESTIHSPANP